MISSTKMAVIYPEYSEEKRCRKCDSKFNCVTENKKLCYLSQYSNVTPYTEYTSSIDQTLSWDAVTSDTFSTAISDDMRRMIEEKVKEAMDARSNESV